MPRPTRREVFDSLGQGYGLAQQTFEELLTGKKWTDYPHGDPRRGVACELEQYGIEVLKTLE